ncbi:hypothetical protein GCM10020255_084150 [Rhodococcus baikonurensis]
MDAELVRRGLARSRDHAQELISAGRVLISGAVATKPATAIEAGTPLRVVEVEQEVSWASRGAHKLIGALDAFGSEGLTVEGRRCLDAGASTGGFTDVLLTRGAKEVVAVDVGYGQLVWRLQSDDRVHVIDRTNVRAIDPETIGGTVDLVVADLSFISLKLVLGPSSPVPLTVRTWSRWSSLSSRWARTASVPVASYEIRNCESPLCSTCRRLLQR